jgi:hypothetical protein
MQVWFVLYFNNEWQSSFAVPANAYNEQGQLVPVPLDARTPQPSFRGCVTVVINAENGEPVEASGPLLTGLIPECDK